MKKFLRQYLVCLFLPFSSQAAYSGSLELVKIQAGKQEVRETRIKLGNAGERTVKTGEKIEEGTEVVTAAEVRLTFISANGNQILVGPNTRITLSSINGHGEEYEVTAGKAWFKVIKQKLGFFNVRHKDYYAQVEGTEYNVAVVPNKEIRIGVDEGRVRALRPVKLLIEDSQKEAQLEVSEAIRAGEEKVYRLDVDAYLVKYKTFKEAESYFRQNLEADRASGDPARLAQGLKEMGWMLIKLTRYNEALPYFKEFLALSESRYPSGVHVDIADALNGMGNAIGQQGGESNVRAAIGYFDKGLAILRQAYPDGLSPKIAIVLNDLGAANFYLGGPSNIEIAIARYTEALSAAYKVYPSGANKDVALILMNLGVAYRNLGGSENTKKAIHYYEESIAASKRIGPDGQNEVYAVTLINLGSLLSTLYSETGNVDQLRKAIDYNDQALKELNRLFPAKPHFYKVSALMAKGVGFAQLGGEENTRTAIGYLNEALEMAKKLDPGSGSLNAAQIYQNLGSAYMMLQGEVNVMQAIANTERALDLRRKLYPSGVHKELALSLGQLGNLYLKTGNRILINKAIICFEELLQINIKLYGPAHSEVGAAYAALGSAQVISGNIDVAHSGIENIEKAIAILRRIPEKPAQDMVNSLNSLVAQASRAIGTPADIRRAERYEAEINRIRK